MATDIYLTEELEKLRHDVLAMAARVEENISKAITALKTGNAELANEVRASDADIDTLQLKIEDDAAFIIATRHPVATDMRELVAILKITGNIERIGDHAAHLAKAARRLAKKDNLPYLLQEKLKHMAETGQHMLRVSINAFMAHDVNMAREAAAMDCKIDEEHKLLTEDILNLMKKKHDNVKPALQVLQTGNQLERLGDHITNICEAIIYMVNGKHEDLNE